MLEKNVILPIFLFFKSGDLYLPAKLFPLLPDLILALPGGPTKVPLELWEKPQPARDKSGE